MNKIIKALAVALGAVAFVPFAVGACTTYAHAEGELLPDVITDSRYSPIGVDDVADLVDYFTDLYEGELPDDNFPDGIVNGAINLFAQKFAELNAKGLEGKAQNYTILDTFSLMGKRRINYPNGDYEVQTSYVFIDKNNINTSPQQFGAYTIAPNTIFIVRNCSWGDNHAFSVPISTNGFTDWNYNTFNGFFEIQLDNNNSTFIYDTIDGRQTVGFRHGGYRVRESWKNNTINTIVENHLVDAYNESAQNYGYYIGEGEHLDDLEAFLGTGYNYGMSQGIMTDLPPWYITTAYFNTNTDYFLESIYNNFNVDPSAPIDPSKPPAYLLPDNTPISKGTQIDNNNDYGMTIIDGELHIDPDILAGALAPLINPDFNGLLGGVFNAQPELGLGFDTPLTLDIPDIISNWFQSLIPVDPARPLVPSITTLSEWDILPAYTTETFPLDVTEGGEQIALHTLDITDALGITSVFLLLALIGLLTYAIF